MRHAEAGRLTAAAAGIAATTRVSTFSQRLNQRYWSATATVWKFPPMRVVNPRDHASLVDHCAARGTDNVTP
jgi:hypothetical protein